MWKTLWSLAIYSTQIEIFLWKQSLNSLPTFETLASRQALSIRMCHLWHHGPKSNIHALWFCKGSRNVWSSWTPSPNFSFFFFFFFTFITLIMLLFLFLVAQLLRPKDLLSITSSINSHVLDRGSPLSSNPIGQVLSMVGSFYIVDLTLYMWGMLFTILLGYTGER